MILILSLAGLILSPSLAAATKDGERPVTVLCSNLLPSESQPEVPFDELLIELKRLSPTLSGEIVAGRVYVKPPRPRDLFYMQNALLTALQPVDVTQGEPTGDWIVNRDPELLLGSGHSKGRYTPELAAWRVEAIRHLPENGRLTVPPDWIAEFISAKTTALDRGLKMSAYANLGVPYLWLIDTNAKLLEVYKLNPQARWERLGAVSECRRIKADPFMDQEIDLSPLWKKNPDEKSH